MEEDIGVPLLVRHPRGVTLTEAGETLAQHARQMIDQHKLLETELKNLLLECVEHFGFMPIHLH